uniref:ATP synthase complex subunit 8 n=1 Tax=Typhlomys cinereus TaxID=687455 RepID=A0A343AU93_9RODE|nr:ATP synthase F0 subunit 8 [Typhlomys cinereus]APQ47839.1 ATP synthase F0 subunit 8 [Typhlomys cinereus]
MPQLDTSTWFTVITAMLITLFMIFQMKISSFYYPNTPNPKTLETLKTNNPWETKWTKIYSPLSLPLQ